jgi:hypothetical protein
MQSMIDCVFEGSAGSFACLAIAGEDAPLAVFLEQAQDDLAGGSHLTISSSSFIIGLLRLTLEE